VIGDAVPQVATQALALDQAIDHYLHHLTAVRGHSAATVRAYAADLQAFAEWLQQQSLSAGWSGVEALVLRRYRDAAVCELFYSSGLRLSELAGLDLSDLDLDAGEARVRGKGRRERIVPVGRRAVAALREWLQRRPMLLPAPSAGLRRGSTPVFVSRRGTRLSTRQIADRIARLGQRHGLDRRLHPHLFRHACATHLLESSGDLRAVQELLGHQSLSTTQIYTHLDFQHLAAVYDQAHPRARRGLDQTSDQRSDPQP